MQFEAARPAIDLTRYAFVRELGDIRLYGSWYTWFDEEEREWQDEPCLVLMPAMRHCSTPCVVALSAAFKYTDPAHLAKVSLIFARQLGFDGTEMSAAHKIGEIIHGHLLDLIKMPENPADAVVGATANVDFGNGRRQEVDIIDYEPTKQI